LIGLAVAASLVATLVVALRMPQPPTIVVVPITAAPAPAVDLRWGNPAWCVGYDWRFSSVDLRPYCGWR
jgi:hypothetical protein